jgi:hypothetical protein
MDRELFERRFLEASSHAREFAKRFIEESLPEPLLFHVHLNSSYDRGAGPRFKLFPQDSSEKMALKSKHLSAGAVVDLLWRDGLVPQWADLTATGKTPDATLLDVTCCGRFIADESALYYTWTPFAPFGVKGPVLPVGWVEGQRFSIYHRSSCWSRGDLVRVMQHPSKLWSLELHGPDFRDDVVPEYLHSDSLELLEVGLVRLRGAGLRCIARLPKLRALRVSLRGGVDFFSFGHMPEAAQLEHLSLDGAPHAMKDVEQLVSSVPRLKSLRLSGQFDSAVDAQLLVPHLEELRLAFPHLPSWAKPGPSLRTLGIHAPASNDGELAVLLADAPTGLDTIVLRGTPVTDAVFESLSRFPKLQYIDVVDTWVTAEGLGAFANKRPGLRFHPRPEKARPPSS